MRAKTRRKPKQPAPKRPTTRKLLSALELRVRRLEAVLERIRRWGEAEGDVE